MKSLGFIMQRCVRATRNHPPIPPKPAGGGLNINLYARPIANHDFIFFHKKAFIILTAARMAAVLSPASRVTKQLCGGGFSWT